jgi:DNA-binding beta-propeller fold protein YncE
MQILFQRRGAETPRFFVRCCFLIAVSVFASHAQGLLYMGAWPKQILVIDEAQQKVIDHIQLETGTPRRIEISHDRKKLFVSTWDHSGVEVVDLVTRKVVNHFSVDEGNRRVHFFQFTSDPQDKVLYATINAAVKQIDRFELEPTKLAVIDLAQQKITKTVEYPKEEENLFSRFAGLRVSPDGKHLYHFRENVLIFDTTDFKLEEKIELAKPLFPGMEHVGVEANNDPADDPGLMHAFFNASDPVVHREIFGIARVDLSKKDFDFTPVGPATLGLMGLYMTPDRKTGYTVAFTHNNPGNRRCEFWVFDMNTRKLVKKVEFAARTRFDFSISSTGKQLYIFGAGATIEIFDTDTLQLQKTIDLQADTTTNLVVVPAKRS